MGWQGDRAAGSKGEMYIFDNSTLYNKWMQDVEESQLEDGNVSDVAPAYWRMYSPNVTWPSAQIFIPQSLYVAAMIPRLSNIMTRAKVDRFYAIP